MTYSITDKGLKLHDEIGEKLHLDAQLKGGRL